MKRWKKNYHVIGDTESHISTDEIPKCSEDVHVLNTPNSLVIIENSGRYLDFSFYDNKRQLSEAIRVTKGIMSRVSIYQHTPEKKKNTPLYGVSLECCDGVHINVPDIPYTEATVAYEFLCKQVELRLAEAPTPKAEPKKVVTPKAEPKKVVIVPPVQKKRKKKKKMPEKQSMYPALSALQTGTPPKRQLAPPQPLAPPPRQFTPIKSHPPPRQTESLIDAPAPWQPPPPPAYQFPTVPQNDPPRWQNVHEQPERRQEPLLAL